MPLFRKRANANSQPNPIGAIVGSGSTYKVASYTDATHLTQLRQQWQQKAFDLYDCEGHLYYATNYIGSALARVNLVAAVKPATDKELSKPKTIETGPVRDAVAEIQSPRSGQSGLMRQLGKNVFLVGECWVIASEVTYPDGSTAQQWDAVSVDELTTSGTATTFLRRSLPGAAPIPLPEGSVAIRIWKEHPRYSELADAGTRSCIELLEKVVVLNRAEKAIARSRLAGSGILALPQELVPPAWQNQAQSGNPMESNPLWQALAESMTAPLKDESHPSSVVPLLLVGPGDVIGKMKYEELSRSFDTAAANSSITVAIEQIANTLELPKEVLLGAGEVNHWTAWAIKEDTFQAHIQPLVELICEALTKTYLKQALAKLSDTEIAEVLSSTGAKTLDEIIVWYDATELVIRPDKGDKAIALHDRFAISDETLRRESGFNDDDKPDDTEYAKRVGIKMADAAMAISGKPPEPPQPPAPLPSPQGEGDVAPEPDAATGGGNTGPKL